KTLVTPTSSRISSTRNTTPITASASPPAGRRSSWPSSCSSSASLSEATRASASTGSTPSCCIACRTSSRASEERTRVSLAERNSALIACWVPMTPALAVLATSDSERAATRNGVRISFWNMGGPRSGGTGGSYATPGVKAHGLPVTQAPVPDDPGDRVDPVGQCGGAGLEDDRRLHLVQLAVAHRRDGVPTRAGGHVLRTELLAAPGAHDDVRRAAHHLGWILQDPRLRQRLGRALREDVVAAGDAHQLGHPTDPGDRRVVPFLEIDLGSARQGGGLVLDAFGSALQFVRPGLRARRRADHRAQAPDVVED